MSAQKNDQTTHLYKWSSFLPTSSGHRRDPFHSTLAIFRISLERIVSSCISEMLLYV